MFGSDTQKQRTMVGPIASGNGVRHTAIYLREISRVLPCRYLDGKTISIRLPDELVQALKLREGDEIEISIAGQRQLTVARDRSRKKGIEELRRLARPRPAGFKFDREELNER